MWTFVAVAVVVVIVLVILFGSNWRMRPGVSYTQGVNASTNAQGNFRDLGDANDPQACQNACDGSNWCNAYTWTQGADGLNTCTGIKNLQTAKLTTGGNYTSGERITGYGAKLMHNFGMESAGSSAAKEGFGKGVTAPNTMPELFLTSNAPKTGLELFGNSKSTVMPPPNVLPELFSPQRAPMTGMELFSPQRAPQTGMELFSPQRAPMTGMELFTNQNPGFGSRLAPYMRPSTIPTSTQMPDTPYA